MGEKLVNHPLQNLDYIVFDCEIASNIFKVRPAGLTNGPKTEADIQVVIWKQVFRLLILKSDVH